MSWTDDQIETLTRMWLDGEYAGDIAAQIGKTRNAVIGKAHRLDLAFKGHQRGGRRVYGDDLRERAKRLRQNGYSYMAIAFALDVSATAVENWLNPGRLSERKKRYRENAKLDRPAA